MLTELMVEGLGVIDRAEIAFEPGATAMTGETGAGKTLVVAALGLLLGDRADRALVQQGAAEARVEARFALPGAHPAVALLRAHGIVDGDEAEHVEVVVARSVGADGRSRARINGRLVTVATLVEILSGVVEIAGQNEHHRLGSASFQRSLLDAYAGADVVRLATEVTAHVRAAARAERAAEELRAHERERARRLDLMRYEIAEIEAAAPEADETERLTEDAARLEHAEAIAAGLAAAVDALRGDGGAEETLERARREVTTLAAVDASLRAVADRLSSAMYEITDVAAELAGRQVAADPEALEQLRARLQVLARLRRKYGDTDRAVLDYLTTTRAQIAELEASGSDLASLEAERDRERDLALEGARGLSARRSEAAVALGSALESSLAELALAGARVEIALEPVDLYEGGLEKVEFLIAANPGENPRPIAKVASGGELSRLALALQLLTTTGSVTTMVFDEVDAGVGGRAAHAVGRSLGKLARASGIQVIVVTHLPQVAAFADRHHRVTKVENDGRISARVERIEGSDRIEELSRMLAGLPESERAREHAVELLELAGGGH